MDETPIIEADQIEQHTSVLISAADAARLVGVSAAAISRAIKLGRLPYVKKIKREYRLDRDTVLDVFKHHTRAQDQLGTLPDTGVSTMDDPHLLSAGEAARAVGVSMAAISRALKFGRLPYAGKTPRGYRIDPAVLFHVFRGRKIAQGNGEAGGVAESSDLNRELVALRIAKAKLEGELERARAMLDAEWRRSENAVKERDSWRNMCEWLMSERIQTRGPQERTIDA